MDIKKYRIGIVGLGPVGIILAIHLKRAGCSVSICDSDKEKVNLIRKEGLHITDAVEGSSGIASPKP